LSASVNLFFAKKRDTTAQQCRARSARPTLRRLGFPFLLFLIS
jgi:hypothetical protein